MIFFSNISDIHSQAAEVWRASVSSSLAPGRGDVKMAHERDIIPVKWVIAANKKIQARVIQSTIQFLELQNLDSCDIIVNLVTCLLFPTLHYKRSCVGVG